jgi:hypothetical protein
MANYLPNLTCTVDLSQNNVLDKKTVLMIFQYVPKCTGASARKSQFRNRGEQQKTPQLTMALID